MAIDNLTMALNGRFPLPLFAETVVDFDTLVRRLSEEIAKPANIRWSLADLQGTADDRFVSSVMLTNIGESKDPESVERVVRGYAQVGKSLESGTPIPYSQNVIAAAKKLAGILNGAITSIRFETPEEDATVRAGVAATPPMPNLVTYGAVEGVVQTLSRRKGLRFTLYDAEFDRAVGCYLDEGQEELMRNAWGNRVIVEGRVSRDPITGRPAAIRRITAVELVGDRREGFRGARGAVLVPASMPLPEVLVRRLRDA